MNKLTRALIAFAAATQLLLATAPSASAQVDVTCLGAQTGVTVQNVIVPLGATCTLTDVRVLGNVEVKEMATVNIRRGSINGDLIVESGGTARLTRGSINGSVQGLGARLVNISGTTIARDIVAEETATLVVGSGASTGSIEVL